MKLIVGLGNPGAQYALTRHNLGFRVVDQLAAAMGREIKTPDCQALILRTELAGERIVLAKPQTYMNLSGQSVAGLKVKLGLERTSEIIVIYDDLALPVGKLRVRARGSAGGHNGIKSLIELLRTDEFPRVRLGLQPAHPIADTKSFVLAPFAKSEQSLVAEMIDRAAEAVRCIITDGIDRAMAQYN